MADEQFYTILTNVGKAKVANAALLNSNVTLKTLKVGDGDGAYYNPTEDQKDLKNVVYTCNVGSVSVDKDNPNWIIAETIIPGSVGGFTIREVGLFDVDGDMIAIGKYPETYKPVVANGASKDLNVRTIFEVSNAASVNLSINPSIIIATKEDIENLQKQITSNDEDIAVLSNPNLLINDEFLVNQRDDGTGYYVIDNINNGQYIFDRWRFSINKDSDSCKLEKRDIGIKISQVSGDSSFCDLTQICERIFKEDTILTASFKFEKSDKASRLALVTEEGTVLNELEFNSTGIYKFTFLQKANKKVQFQFRIHTNGIGELGYLRWCKLEIGDKATPFYPRSYGEELALCKRYYQPDVVLNFLAPTYDVYWDIILTNYIKMRIKPTLKSLSGVDGVNGSIQKTGTPDKLIDLSKSIIEIEGGKNGKHNYAVLKGSDDSVIEKCNYVGFANLDAEIY